MPKIQLPPGCESLKFRDKSYYGKPGGHVTVSDEHARRINSSRNGSLGIVNYSGIAIGTPVGKRCTECRFLAQGWNDSCPKCGGDVVTE